MKVAVHSNGAVHQVQHAEWMAAGLRRHGVEVIAAAFNEPVPCDAAMVWGWRQDRVIGAGPPVLCMERGHVQPRMEWTSLGWDGLAGRGTYPKAKDGGARWDRLYARHMQDERRTNDGYALVMGQVPGDAALAGTDIHAWAVATTRALLERGYAVRFRPHPLCVLRNDGFCPEGAVLSIWDLAEDLRGACLAATFNSTSGIECVLAGVPTVVMDRGGMAWPVAAHTLDDAGRFYDRTEWSHDLAWTQWSPAEIRDGTAWEAVRDVMPVMA